MKPTMTPTKDLPTQLREFNRWRRGDETLEQPHPKDIGVMLDEAADRLEELELKNQIFRAAQKACEDCDAPRVDRIAELERELAAERALADRLAASLEDCRDDSAELLSDHSWWQDEPRCGYAERYKENAKNITRAVEALAAWKEARRE